METGISNAQCMRLRDVLKVLSISRSTWYKGIKDGKFPKPIKLTERTSVWRGRDIIALIES